MTILQLEKFILKLNATAIEFIKSSGDPQKHNMAKEFLAKAETTLLNSHVDSNKNLLSTGSQRQSVLKNKLLAIT
jgi:hypothetical protein